MRKKYIMVEEEHINHRDRKLYRIRAIRNFGTVKKGDLGGYIEDQYNLGHEGDCWIYDKAKVWGNAEVRGNVSIYDRVELYDNAGVHDDAVIYDDVKIYGRAKIYDKVLVGGDARIYDSAIVMGYTDIRGAAMIYGMARIEGRTRIFGEDICTSPVFRMPVLPRDPITVTDKYVYIGCEQHTLVHWLKHYKTIGKNHYYTTEEIELYYKALCFISNLSEMGVEE